MKKAIEIIEKRMETKLNSIQITDKEDVFICVDMHGKTFEIDISQELDKEQNMKYLYIWFDFVLNSAESENDMVVGKYRIIKCMEKLGMHELMDKNAIDNIKNKYDSIYL